MKVISNKEKIQIGNDDGGEGDISDCTASDSECSGIGLGNSANEIGRAHV